MLLPVVSFAASLGGIPQGAAVAEEEDEADDDDGVQRRENERLNIFFNTLVLWWSGTLFLNFYFILEFRKVDETRTKNFNRNRFGNFAFFLSFRKEKKFFLLNTEIHKKSKGEKEKSVQYFFLKKVLITHTQTSSKEKEEKNVREEKKYFVFVKSHSVKKDL